MDPSCSKSGLHYPRDKSLSSEEVLTKQTVLSGGEHYPSFEPYRPGASLQLSTVNMYRIFCFVFVIYFILIEFLGSIKLTMLV